MWYITYRVLGFFFRKLLGKIKKFKNMKDLKILSVPSFKKIKANE